MVVSAEDAADPCAIGVPRFSRSAQTFPILEDLARTIRAMQYSIRTEQSYVDWCHRLLPFRREQAAGPLGRPRCPAVLESPGSGALGLGQDAEPGVQRGGVSVQTPLEASARGREVLYDEAACTASRGLESRRDAGAVGTHGRHTRIDGPADVRHGDAFDGVRAAAGARSGLRQRLDIYRLRASILDRINWLARTTLRTESFGRALFGAQFQKEVGQVLDQSVFEVGFGILVLEVEEFQDEGVRWRSSPR